MNVLVDTSVWSLVLRRRTPDLAPAERNIVEEWGELVREGRIVLFGPVRQEMLSGIKREQDFERLRDRAADFEDEPLVTADYEQAARFWNVARRAGVTAGHIDFLLCAAAHRRGLAVFTTDGDFENLASKLPIALYRVRGRR